MITMLLIGSPEPGWNCMLPVTPVNWEIFASASRTACPVCRPSGLQRPPQQIEGIVGQGGSLIRRAVVLGCIGRYEFLSDWSRVIDREGCAEIRPFAICSALPEQLRLPPGVAAQKWDADPQAMRLLHLGRDVADNRSAAR